MISLYGNWTVFSRIESRTTVVENEDATIVFDASRIESMNVGSHGGLYVNIASRWDTVK